MVGREGYCADSELVHAEHMLDDVSDAFSFAISVVRIFRGALFGMCSVPVSSRARARVDRYNKEMLGKHKWKFPAPFLMNAVHFTMQALASRVVVWFQQRGLEGGTSKMTWRDYFTRGV
jgi:hypothetical protein